MAKGNRKTPRAPDSAEKAALRALTRSARRKRTREAAREKGTTQAYYVVTRGPGLCKGIQRARTVEVLDGPFSGPATAEDAARKHRRDGEQAEVALMLIRPYNHVPIYGPGPRPRAPVRLDRPEDPPAFARWEQRPLGWRSAG